MKMKKMLAILAALSVLGTTGLTVGAEDTATTTEPATEAITTTEIEAETTAAETEEITETTTEEVKAVEDSNREEKIYATKEYTMGSHAVKVVLYNDGTLDDSENPVECMSVYVDGNLTNLSGVVVNTAMNGDGSNTSIQDPDSFFAVTGTDAILVTPYSLYGNPVAYTYDEATNTFVTAGTASTTTTTTAAETTTTTTTTTTSEADLEAAKKALYEIYAAKYKPVHAIKEDVEYHIVDGVLTSATIIVQDDDEKVVKTFFVTKDGATLINSVRMGGMGYGFKSTDFTCNGYQFYAQIVQPASDADVRSYLTIYVYDKDGNLVPTNINGMQIGSVLYTGVDGKVGWTQGYDWVLSDYFSSNGDSITINRSIAAFIDVSTSMQYTLTSDSTTYTYDAATNTFVTGGSTPTTPDEEMTTIEIYNNGLVTLSGTVSYEKDMTNYWHDILTLDKPVKVIYMDSMGGMVEPGTTEVIDSVQISFDRTVSIPEGAHITVTGSAMHSHTAHHLRSLVLMDCTYQLDGKTDNGSASNAPATKNTSGTPKTGDTTTVPAVAVGLTLTAAGVVAFISKRKK